MSAARKSLSLLARGLCARSLTVETLDTGEGTRPVIGPGQLLLPDIDAAPNVRRAMVAHAAAHLLHSTAGASAAKLKPMSIAIISAIEDARVERLLCRDFPGVHDWFVQAMAPPPDETDLSFAALLTRLHRILLVPGAQDTNYWVNKAQALFEKAVSTAGLRDDHAFRAIASVLANDLGQMRVRFQPQSYVVPAPYRDDNSWLWTFEDDDSESIDSARAATSDPAPPAGSAGMPTTQPRDSLRSEIRCLHYPEWDYKRAGLRMDWCTVMEHTAPRKSSGMVDDAQGQTLPMKAMRLPASTTNRGGRWHRLRAQQDGDTLDLDAVIDHVIDQHADGRYEGRVFLRHEPDATPRSTLVLLDLSESTNARRGGGLSILELEKRAASVLIDADRSSMHRLAIHGFSSATRHEIHYHRLLDFGQTPDASTRATLQAVQGRFSTRMGAALRHAVSLMKSETAEQKSILLVTDGEPADIDVHDPRYLVEDALVAVAQARQSGVRAACLLVGTDASRSVQRVFGLNNYRVATTADRLPLELSRVYQRLARTRSL